MVKQFLFALQLLIPFLDTLQFGIPNEASKYLHERLVISASI